MDTPRFEKPEDDKIRIIELGTGQEVDNQEIEDVFRAITSQAFEEAVGQIVEVDEGAGQVGDNAQVIDLEKFRDKRN